MAKETRVPVLTVGPSLSQQGLLGSGSSVGVAGGVPCREKGRPDQVLALESEK